jgi:subfamily B ATP-binding cassette protein MsbA
MTTLVITHRTSTLAFCDDGIVLDAGRVVEAGELVDLDAYRKIASLIESEREL